MWNNFLTVSQQVLILFVLVLLGYILGKRGIINEKGGKVCSDLALLLATPCVIISSFQRPFDVTTLQGLLIALAVAFGLHVVAIAVAHLIYRKDDSTTRVYRTSAVLSNAGFMGLPLQQAVLGSQGVLYGTAYVVAMTMALWSYGLILMDKDGGRVSWRKICISPGTVGLAIGLLFVCRVSLPELILVPVQHVAALNTPLPMLFAGYYLSRVDMKAAFGRRENYVALAVRLLLVPVVGIGLAYLCGVRGMMLTSMAIAVSAPTAIAVAMFADRYKQDAETAVNLVAISTVLSAVTMPLLVATVQLIA